MTSTEIVMATSSSPKPEQKPKADAIPSDGKPPAEPKLKSPAQLDQEAVVAEDGVWQSRRWYKLPYAEDDLMLRRDQEMLDDQWYTILYEEDSLLLMKLLEEYSDGGLWKRGWEAQHQRQVRGRRLNYWAPERETTWKGRTALHVGVKRGNLQLIEKVLKLCKDENSEESSLQKLLLAEDGAYGLNAIAMAVVNGNRDIVTLLLEAASEFEDLSHAFNIQVFDNAHSPLTGGTLAEDGKLRDKLREITRDVIQIFKGESWFEGSVLRRYELNRDFNFLPLDEYPEYLFHFLFTGLGPASQQASELMNIESFGLSGDWLEAYKLYAGRISVLVLTEIAARAIKSPELLVYMWTMQDGQGRAPLHVAVDEEEYDHLIRSKALTLTRSAFSVDEETLKKTISHALDGQGRTAVHRAAAQRLWRESSGKLLDLETGEGYDTFHSDKFGGPYRDVAKKYTPDGFDDKLMKAASRAFRDCLAVGFERTSAWTSSKGRTYSVDLFSMRSTHLTHSKVLWSGGTPIHAAILRSNDKMCSAIGEAFVKEKKEKRNPSYVDRDITAIVDGEFSTKYGTIEAPRHINERKRFVLDVVGFAACRRNVAVARAVLDHHGTYQENKREEKHIPAVCLVAAWGQYNVLQSLIDAKHDPSEEDFAENTVLHHATKGMSVAQGELTSLSLGLLDYVNFSQLLEDLHLRKYQTPSPTLAQCQQALVDRQGCINLLIQQGCDIFKTNKMGEAPYPSGNADPEFLKWWHGIQGKEFEVAQSAQSMAANAISVTAALVATASYVGPLQPPLGYSDDDPTQLRLEIMAVKVFIVCDTTSFYLAIAAIIFALVPCLPMPQQPMKDELRRTRRMVNTSVCVLFPSIICILVAFAAGSIAVIQTNKDKWNRGGLTIGSASFGGLVCMIAIAVFSIRVLKIIFHRNKTIKRIYEATSF